MPEAQRHELQKLDGKRFRCRATVERFGNKTAFKGPPISTILLRDVTASDSGKLLTDHLWFTTGKWSAGLVPGDTIEFEARSADYIKGYRGRREVYDAPITRDWKLQRPTKVRVLARETTNDAVFGAGDPSPSLFQECLTDSP